jgi:cephalosporin hydroxylase
MPLKCETNLLQDITEFNHFLQLIRKHNVRSYLEIGSKHGGSFWRITNSLPRGSRVVSVDLPHGDGSFKVSEPNLRACVDALKSRGYDAHLFLADSTDPATVEKVRQLGPFDLVFVDANHTGPYVRADWENYGPLTNMIAFHDIGFRQLPHKRLEPLIQVPKFWDDLKNGYKHIEIRCCEASNGIGVLWRN